MKLSGNVENDMRTGSIDFGDVLDHCLDPGIFLRIF